MSVFDLKIGESGRVTTVNVDGAAGERLASLGVKKGQIITAVAFSVFRGSVLITIGYNRLAVRKSVARRIEVEVC